MTHWFLLLLHCSGVHVFNLNPNHESQGIDKAIKSSNHNTHATSSSSCVYFIKVNALKVIWGKLGLADKKDWDFDFHKDPCGKVNRDLSVLCDCSFESNVTCHVIALSIPSQNVSTALPSEFAKLQYLQDLDLSCNYLTGTIPSEWATMRLSTLSLMGNQLSGPFPTVLTRITTLLDLNIEGNHFSGPIPKDIANLRNLRKLRISDNNFIGKIPNFISQWTQIRNL